MSEGSIKDILGNINKKFGEGTVLTAREAKSLSYTRIPTGILDLDIGMGIGENGLPGIPRGRIALFKGNESTGKTTIGKKHIAEAQKMCRYCNTYIQAEVIYDASTEEYSFVDRETGEIFDEKDYGLLCECGNPTPMVCVYMDAEGGYDPEWASELGVDNDRVYLIQPEFAEEAVDVAEAMIRSGAVDVLIVDSIAELVPSVEIESSSQDQQMGVHARLMNKFMRLIVSGINSLGMDNPTKPTVILINQKRVKIGGYGNPTTLPGGVGQNFRSSIIVDLRMIERVTKDGRKWTTQSKDDPAGVLIAWRTDKNKTAPPFQQGNFKIYSSDSNDGHLKGETNTEEQLIDLAIEYGIIERSGSWFAYQDIKKQGKPSITEALREDKELFAEVKELTLQKITENIER